MSETKFSVMSSLFNWMQKSKSSSVKRSKFRKFLDTFCRPNNSDDYFAAIRLILPGLDRERGSYGLREYVLATCLIDALGMSRDSPDAQRLINWRKGGPRSGAFAGNFSLIAAEVLQRRQGLTSGALTIKELNDLLDRLSSSENRKNRVSILSDLIMKTNAQEMKWIVMIILKDLKLGISEKSIFHEFHPDAEDLFNVTCDLKLVCEKLRDRSQRHKRQDIEVGKPVRPQLALRVSNAAAAWKKLHGKELVIECKFDGDRIQIHKNGADINYFSRNFLNHPEYEHGMSDIIRENILVDRCILDGEMLVWDKAENRFVEFGSNQEIAKAAREGLDRNRQLCYVAFDILYVGDTSVIHQSLKERHQLLREVIKPIAGRLEILVPNGGLNVHRPAGEPCWSLVVHDVDAVERFFKETVENRDEGIVIKDLGSKWEPSDRSGKWLKLKPDYVRAGSDLDVLIIGGYYGSGRHGGEVAQFLVGLAETPAANKHPKRFVSFCRVGTGLSDEELNAVVTKLTPFLRKNEYPKKAPPSFYQVTNKSKERPDVWVESPEKSIILSITSDIRTIRSEVFAAPYSLRFPRIDRVRYDKPWHECLDVQSFVDIVHSSNGTTQRPTDAVTEEQKPKRRKLSRGDKRNLTDVPYQFVQTDVSQVKGDTSIFSNLMFYFVNVPSSKSLDSLHKMVVENGGAFSMNLNNSVTHCISSEAKGIKFQAAKRQGDVIDYSWFSDCCSQKKLLPLQPKNFLFLSDASKKKLQEEIDEFSDPYYVDLIMEELKQTLVNVPKVKDSKAIEHYKKKYCPKEEWIRFHGCCIYFHLPRQIFKNMNEIVPFELAIRRMKVEVSLGGGSIAERLSGATHLVVVCDLKVEMDFKMILSSFSGAEKRLLRSKKLQIVKFLWLEDSLEKNQKLPEDSYIIIPQGSEEILSADSDEGKRSASISSSEERQRKSKSTTDNLRVVNLPNVEGKRKRGRPTGTSTLDAKKGKPVPGKTRPHIGNRPAKIDENRSDEDGASNNNADFKANSPNHEKPGILKSKGKGKSVVNKPRRARAQIRNKQAKLVEEEPDEDLGPSESVDVFVPESSRTLPGDVEMPNNINEAASGSEMRSNESHEEVVDPIQAMLFNMLPALALKKTENVNPVTEEDKSSGVADSSREEHGLPFDGELKTVKKKKVSYKDVANELLKDW